ncbi:MAG: hypothetical protein IPO14_11235 [Saprospiraceae bacterium]|nr:hypothetical protein [Saprospiraceae bacterium]
MECCGNDADVTHPTTGAVLSNRLFLDLIFGLLLYQDKSDRKLRGLKAFMMCLVSVPDRPSL